MNASMRHRGTRTKVSFPRRERIWLESYGGLAIEILMKVIQMTEYELPSIFMDSINGSRGTVQRDIALAGLELIIKVLEKNADYGSSAFESPVLAPHVSAADALRSRQSDKVKRILQLASLPPEVAGESLEDSLDDFAGYNILDLVLRNRRNG